EHVRQGLFLLRVRPAGFERSLGGRFQTCERRAEVVGNVVERLAHCVDKALDPVEHGVKKYFELVDRVASLSDRKTRAEVAGLDDPGDGGAELIQGAAGAPGSDGALR